MVDILKNILEYRKTSLVYDAYDN